MHHHIIICDIFTGLCRVGHSLESGDVLLPCDDCFVFSLLNNVQVSFTDTSPKGKRGGGEAPVATRLINCHFTEAGRG